MPNNFNPQHTNFLWTAWVRHSLAVTERIRLRNVFFPVCLLCRFDSFLHTVISILLTQLISFVYVRLSLSNRKKKRMLNPTASQGNQVGKLTYFLKLSTFQDNGVSSSVFLALILALFFTYGTWQAEILHLCGRPKQTYQHSFCMTVTASLLMTFSLIPQLNKLVLFSCTASL